MRTLRENLELKIHEVQKTFLLKKIPQVKELGTGKERNGNAVRGED